MIGVVILLRCSDNNRRSSIRLSKIASSISDCVLTELLQQSGNDKEIETIKLRQTLNPFFKVRLPS